MILDWHSSYDDLQLWLAVIVIVCHHLRSTTPILWQFFSDDPQADSLHPLLFWVLWSCLYAEASSYWRSLHDHWRLTGLHHCNLLSPVLFTFTFFCSVAKVLDPAASDSEGHLLPILRQEAFRASNLEAEDKTLGISFQGQGGRWPPPHGRGTVNSTDGDEHVALLSMLAGEVCLSVGHGDPVHVRLVPLDHGPRNSSGRLLLVFVVQVDGHQGTSHATVLLRERLPFGPQGLLARVLAVIRAAEDNALEAGFVAPLWLSYNQMSVISEVFSACFTSFSLIFYQKLVI